jgi:DNA-binding transcriptional LysR family regulator
MDIKSLKEFIVVTRHLSFTKAAEELNSTQPGISKHMVALEKEVGTQLFRREGIHLSLTPLGKVFLQNAREIVGQYNNMMRQMKELSGQKPVKLTIRIFEGSRPVKDIVASAITKLKKNLPLVDITVEYIHNSPFDEIRKGLADISICMPAASTDLTRLVTEPLFSEPMVAVVNKEHRLANQGTLAFEDIKGEKVWFSTDPHSRDIFLSVEEMLTGRGVDVVFSEAPWLEDSFALRFESGMIFVNASSEHMVPLALRHNLSFLKLPEGSMQMCVQAAYREGDENPNIPLFIQTMREVIANMDMSEF